MAERCSAFDWSTDHYEDVNRINEELMIKKTKLLEVIGKKKSHNYLSNNLEQRRYLYEEELEAIKNYLHVTALNLTRFSKFFES